MLVRSITPDEIKHFHDSGWAYLPGLVNADIARQMSSHAEDALLHRQQKKVGAEGEIIDRSILAFHGEDRTSNYTRDVTLSPTMGDNLNGLLKTKRTRLFVDRFLLKGPQSEGQQDQTLYHQDFPGHSSDRSSFLTIWVALHDMTAAAGTMRFYNGSHRKGVFGQVFADGVDLRERCPELREEDLSPPINMRAGDATAHHSLVVHGAPPNLTKARRWSYIMIYADAEARYSGVPGQMPEGVTLNQYDHFDHPAFPLVPIS